MDGAAHEHLNLEIKRRIRYKVLAYGEIWNYPSQIPVQQCGLNASTDGTKTRGSHVIPLLFRFFGLIISGDTLADSVTGAADGKIGQHFCCKWV